MLQLQAARDQEGPNSSRHAAELRRTDCISSYTLWVGTMIRYLALIREVRVGGNSRPEALCEFNDLGSEGSAQG